MATTSKEVKQAIKMPQFRIETVQRRERYLKLLVYGNYGVGKTTLACSALEVPSMRDVIMINAEAGDLSVDHMDGLDAITVRDFRTLGRINEFLKQHCKARDEGDKDELIKMEAFLRDVDKKDIEEPREYHTVILDSLTELEAYCFNQLLGITDTTRLDEETQSSEWTEYKKNNTMMLRVVRAFRDLPMHVIFTCAESYTQDETKKFKYTPDMTGKLSKKIQGFMDMVGYYAQAREGDVVRRRLFVMPSAQGKYDAKHRYQTFKKEFFDDPTIGAILKQVGLLKKDGTALK
jgi:hypothetical protein